MAQRLITACLIVVLGGLMLGGVTALAQDATPSAEGGLPVTPDPSECTVEPLTLDEFFAVVGTPVPGSPDADGEEEDEEAASPASPAAFALPEGEPADESIRAAITAQVRMALACFNAGNFLAFLALGTDNWLRADAEEPPTAEDAAFLAATPQAAEPAVWSTLVAVRDVIVLPDGRVGALVDTIFPDEGPEVQTDFIIFAEEDGEWKFDEIAEDLEDQFPPEAMATPAA